MALDLKTGAVRGANQLTKGDNYIIGCAGGVVYVSSALQGRSGTPGMVPMAFSVDGR